jgi:hypothetical protein
MQPHIRDAIAKIPETDWQTLADYPEGGEAQIAQTMLGSQRLVVRRTQLVGEQAELFPDRRHFAFITNRTDPSETVEADHRQHAVVELAIRDLKAQALAHFPCGRSMANAAWTVIACQPAALDHPDRPAQQHGSGRAHPTPTAAHAPRSPARTAPRFTLHLPARWSWQHDFILALARIRALPGA